MVQLANVDKIKDQENLFGNCLIESSSAILVVGKWPSFYTDEGSALLKDFLAFGIPERQFARAGMNI